MNDDIYVLVESGECDERYSFFIKIKESDRGKFKDFARDTYDIDWDEYLYIVAMCKYVELVDDTTKIITIQECQTKIKEELAYILEYENHYLKGQEDYLLKLLEYDFELVD